MTKTIGMLLLVFSFFNSTQGQSQDPKQGHKIPPLQVKGIPESLVYCWWEDAAVYDIKPARLREEVEIKNRNLNGSLEFDTVNFNKGFEFNQDTLYTLAFRQCELSNFRLMNLKSGADLNFDSCKNKCPDTAVLKKRLKNGDFSAKYEAYCLLAGNHFNEVSFQRSVIGCGLIISGDAYSELTFSGGHIASITMGEDSVAGQTLFYGVHTDSVYLEESHLQSLMIYHTAIKSNLSLINCTLTSTSYWNGTMGGRLMITGLNVDKSAELNLTGLKPFISGSRIDFYTDGKNINQINLTYRDFRLCFADGTSEQDRETIYTLLLDNFTSRHQEENRMLLDKEFQSFRYRKTWLVGPLVDDVVCAWWDYGYARGRVFLCTFVLLAFFSLVNYWFFERLNRDVYQLDNFLPDFSDKKFLYKVANKLYYSFIYTAVVFLKISVNFSKLFYERKALLAWFFFMYITGFFCIFFIINAILKF